MQIRWCACHASSSPGIVCKCQLKVPFAVLRPCRINTFCVCICRRVDNFRHVQVAFTDITQLERVVSILAYGDILAENTRELTEVNFVHIFRLAQLALDYLLHVQDTLDRERRLLLARECASLPAAPLCMFACLSAR